MALQIKKFIGICAAVVLLAVAFLLTILENTYVTYPRIPNPGRGRIVPYTVKGVVIYITSSQYDLLSWLSSIETGSAVVIALVILIHRGDPFRSKN